MQARAGRVLSLRAIQLVAGRDVVRRCSIAGIALGHSRPACLPNSRWNVVDQLGARGFCWKPSFFSRRSGVTHSVGGLGCAVARSCYGASRHCNRLAGIPATPEEGRALFGSRSSNTRVLRDRLVPTLADGIRGVCTRGRYAGEGRACDLRRGMCYCCFPDTYGHAEGSVLFDVTHQRCLFGADDSSPRMPTLEAPGRGVADAIAEWGGTYCIHRWNPPL